ncbi:sulfatase [Marivita sp. S6314]|uniref:sulfatase n=1 Tax=Marivita sp. S6314 TaxID=2926406 RepID=UPI001FF179EF|nr:sulfatase [Marivita sp. S6314]MCK0149452.1 sulfatase [Marivita sp. S6314]
MTRSTLRRVLVLCLATLVLHIVLIQPNHPAAMTWRALLLFPLELPALICALIALGHTRASGVFRGILVVSLTAIVVLKTADFVSFNALSRGFNPVADFPLITAFGRLLLGALGPVLTVLACIAALAAIGMVAWILWWATGIWAGIMVPRAGRQASAVIAVCATGIAIAEIGHVMGRWSLTANPPGAAFTARVGVERVVMVRNTLAELRAFHVAVQQDPFADASNLFTAIDRDVLVIFIESYGRTSIDIPFFADLHRETLATYDTELRELGLSMRSGILKSPTKGGQSWLAHASIANGLWIDNQVRYGAALTSGRQTLYHHAQRNGFHTGAVMPQITLDWPEADRMGFDTVLPAKDLGYKGLPFNWVTMPDQFTLAALDRLLRETVADRHVFAQVALASSHAPWTPVPDVIAWDDIGDGTIYNDAATSGDPPDVVWRDRERVRLQYKLAVNYSLQTVFEYAALHAADPPLMIVIGDHQAAELIARDHRSDVPVHVIGPRHLVAPLSALAPTDGLIPADDVPVIAMDSVRDILLKAYTTPPSTEVAN